MTSRALKTVHRANRDDIADLTTRRPLPTGGLAQVDPFLFLNHHGPQYYPPNNNGLPFGPHPHRGFETVTFMIEGSLAHQDSSGAQSVVADGGVQWMSAARGVIHSEMPEQNEGRMEGFQLLLEAFHQLCRQKDIRSPSQGGATVLPLTKYFVESPVGLDFQRCCGAVAIEVIELGAGLQ